MSLNMIPFPSQNAITTIFGLINIHLYDNFARFNNQSLGKFNNDFKTEILSYINYEQEKNKQHNTFNQIALSDFVYKWFNQFDPNESGDLVLNLIKHSKNNLVPWFNENLKQFCSNFTVTESQYRVQNLNINGTIITNSETIIPETQQTQSNLNSVQNPINNSSSSTVNNLQALINTNNSSDSILVSKADLREILNEFSNNQFKTLDSFFTKSISSTTKEEHFNELKSLTETLISFSNAKSINEAHSSANIFPKSVQRDRFPTAFYNKDPKFVNDFEKLILSFQNEIMKFINNHQSNTISETEKLIQEKLSFIEMYDNSIKDKYLILKDELTKRLKPSLEIGMEKLNKLIVENNKPSKTKSKNRSKSNSKPGSRSTSPIIINDNSTLNKSNSSSTNNNFNRRKSNKNSDSNKTIVNNLNKMKNNVHFPQKNVDSNFNNNLVLNKISSFDTPHIRKYNNNKSVAMNTLNNNLYNSNNNLHSNKYRNPNQTSSYNFRSFNNNQFNQNGHFSNQFQQQQ